jgi:hypothetical protein
MSGPSKSRLTLGAAVLGSAALFAAVYAAEEPRTQAGKKEAPGAAKSSMAAVKPKPLSANVTRGLGYLIEQQHADGGWGQGGGWRTVEQGNRIEGPNVEDPSDVANTCIATLALLRAGNTPRDGVFARNVVRAVEFICGHVEKADKDSLYVTGVRGTQVQSKIGPYADTFLASVVLAEVKGKMPAKDSEKRLVAALEKTVHKIQKNQQADGTFAGNGGWAPVFSQTLASKGLNRAVQAGVPVDGEALARADKQALASLDIKNGTFDTGGLGLGGGVASASPVSGFGAARAGGAYFADGAVMRADAGVRLYNFSNQTSALQEAVNTNKVSEKKAREILGSKTASKPEKEKAKQELDRIAKVDEAHKVAVRAVVDQLGDKGFVQGFGSNGGEEFLSYLNISETLVAQGGAEWEKWDRSMTENLNRIQNKDGSWAGDHCITGRTFCTASALLVLMADRTPKPVIGKLAEKK